MTGSIFPTKGKYLVPKQPLLLASYKETAVIILYSSIRRETKIWKKIGGCPGRGGNGGTKSGRERG